MKIPTPKFIKIRLLFQFMAFLVIYLMVGAIKDVWAVEGWRDSNNKCYAGYRIQEPTSLSPVWFRGWDSWSYSPPHFTWVSSSTQPFAWQQWHKGDGFYFMSWNGVGWKEVSNGRITAGNSYPLELRQQAANDFDNHHIPLNIHPDAYWPSGPPDNCGFDPCENEADSLASLCGGPEGTAWEWTDQVSCIGQCFPCYGPLPSGQMTYADAVNHCKDIKQTFLFYSTFHCQGVCTGFGNGQPECSSGER